MSCSFCQRDTHSIKYRSAPPYFDSSGIMTAMLSGLVAESAVAGTIELGSVATVAMPGYLVKGGFERVGVRRAAFKRPCVSADIVRSRCVVRQFPQVVRARPAPRGR